MTDEAAIPVPVGAYVASVAALRAAVAGLEPNPYGTYSDAIYTVLDILGTEEPPMHRPTSTVLAHVQAERQMQSETWDDDDKTPEDWDGLLVARLRKAQTTPDKRYVRLIQLAAVAVAAAERVAPPESSRPPIEPGEDHRG